MEAESFCAGDTFSFGRRLGERAARGDVYVLSGDLGAGKTVLAQGFAAGLGIEGPVGSPTFTILQEYEGGRMPLYHFDAYRLDDAEEMEDVGYLEYFYGEGACLVEWGERIRGILPPTAKEIRIEKDLGKGFDYRKITVEGI